jgi:hypothetical protein
MLPRNLNKANFGRQFLPFYNQLEGENKLKNLTKLVLMIAAVS